MQRGLTLLSDEAACFTTPVGTVLPHARPLKLSRRSRRLLGVSGPADPDAEIGLAAAFFGPAEVGESSHRCVAVLLPLRETGRSATIEPVRRSDVLTALLQSRLLADATGWPPERAWTYLAELVRKVRVARLRYDDPHQAAEVLATLLSNDSASSAG